MSYFSSSIGRKQLMGLSGLVMTGFAAGHMAGNLTMFGGPEMYNSYGHAIVSNKPLLYGTEVILILALITHTIMGFLLTAQNKAARNQKYAMATNGDKSAEFASKSMIYHGVALLGFIIWHLITFKFGEHYDVTYNGVVMRDLFTLMVEKFNPSAFSAVLLKGTDSFSLIFQSLRYIENQ